MNGNAVRVRFVNLELDLGLMYAGSHPARNAKMMHKRKTIGVHSSYQAAVYHARSLFFGEQERNELNDKKKRVESCPQT
jgi:hypothetical protein